MKSDGWPEAPSMQAITVVQNLLGRTFRGSSQKIHANHWVSSVNVAPEKEGFDLALVGQELRTRLDEIGWLFITLKGINDGDLIKEAFAIAPIQPIKLDVGYHASRACMIRQIMEEGLMPRPARIKLV